MGNVVISLCCCIVKDKEIIDDFLRYREVLLFKLKCKMLVRIGCVEAY